MKKIDERERTPIFSTTTSKETKTCTFAAMKNKRLERVYATVRRVYMNDYVLAIDSVT